MKISNVPLDSPDKPPIMLVTVIVVITFLIVYAAWFVSDALLSTVTDDMQAEIETGMGNKKRLSYIEKEEQYLNSEAKLENGTHKIPIDEAMARVIEKENK